MGVGFVWAALGCVISGQQVEEGLDPDGDGVDWPDDCANRDPNTFPGAAAHESETACMTDADGDGYGASAPNEHAEPGMDCDDSNPTVYPGAAEICEDFVVNDCQSDEDDAWEYCFGAEIDLSTTPADTTLVGLGSSAQVRPHTVSGPGDVLGDGGDDVLIGSYVDRSEGAITLAWIFSGSSEGNLTTQSPAVEITADLGDDYFGGTSVASSGDLNGDGNADVLIGAWLSDTDQRGTAWLFYGPIAPGSIDVAAADFTWQGLDGVRAGGRIEFVGQVDGEGGDELLISGEYYLDGSSSPYRVGSAYLIYGSSPQSGQLPAVADVALFGAVDGGFFGSDVSGAGDFDGSGLADILIGADSVNGTRGQAYVFTDDTLQAARNAGGDIEMGRDNPDYTVGGDLVDARAGVAVSPAGDINCDGYSDVLVGAARRDNVGAAYVVLGGDGESQDVQELQVLGEHSAGRFGSSVAAAGDVNADGYDDFLIGDNMRLSEGGGVDDEGYAYLFLGGPDYSSQATLTPYDAASRIAGPQTKSVFGNAVAGVGDGDGDGFDDFAITSRSHLDDNQVNVGFVAIFRGTSW